MNCALIVLAINTSSILRAHDGPPFPILSDHVTGPYVVSIWTDPDTTDDGTAGGQFWIMIAPVTRTGELPADTRASVTVTPLDRPGAALSASAAPVRGDATNQFAAVLMDHEGRFAVRVAIDGRLGKGSAEATVDATYDTRPAPGLLIVYLAPFVAVGLLWARLLARRRTLPKKMKSTRRSNV
jgi:hypothetical protein